MPSLTLNLNVENAPNPARKHFENTNIWSNLFPDWFVGGLSEQTQPTTR